jgi:hypothetical protein
MAKPSPHVKLFTTMRCWPLHLLLPLLAISSLAAAQDAPPDSQPIKLKLTDACIIHIVNGEITLDSKLRGMRIPRQAVDLEELGGSTYMELRPNMYRFDHFRTDPSLSLNVECRGDRISIEYTSPTSNIRYTQSGEGPNGFGYKQAGITIYDTDGSYKTSITAVDFATLRKEHPSEVMQYLAPLFRELRVTEFFPDPRVAAQVLDAQAGKDVSQQVLPLLKQLDADSFKDREHAIKSLANLGPDAVAILEKIDRAQLSPQQQTEVDAFLHARLSFEQLAEMRKDAGFLLDCLYLQDPKIRTRALAILKSDFKADLDLDPATDLLPKAAAIEAVRAKLKPTTKPAE